MAKVLITDELLKDMVNTIVDEVHPERIYLFGSHARGEAREHSDVDLLVVERGPFGPEHSRIHEMARLNRLLARFSTSTDVLVFSNDEIEAWRGTKNHVIARALREGRLLYDRTGSRA